MNRVIDFDTDTLSSFCSSCQDLSSLINEINIVGNGEAFSYYRNNYSNDIKSYISSINDTLKSIESHIKKYISNSELADLGYEEYDFGVLSDLLSAISVAKGPVVSADEYLKTIADENGNVIIDDYTYNIGKHSLIDPDGNIITVSYFMPENANLSQLNTITIMGGVGDLDVSDKNGKWEGLKNIESNALIICPKKNNGDDRFSDYPVASTTIFGNLFTKNQNPVNTIIGCSNGGAAAVTTPARNPDIYQKAIVCNYEPLMVGFNNGKGVGYSLLTDEDIISLIDQGIDITYINCQSDPNICSTDESGKSLMITMPHLVEVINNYEEKNPNFHITFLSNQDDGISRAYDGNDKAQTLGNWANQCDYITFSNDIAVFAEFLGIDIETAKGIRGHGTPNGCPPNGYLRMSEDILKKGV